MRARATKPHVLIAPALPTDGVEPAGSRHLPCVYECWEHFCQRAYSVRCEVRTDFGRAGRYVSLPSHALFRCTMPRTNILLHQYIEKSDGKIKLAARPKDRAMACTDRLYADAARKRAWQLRQKSFEERDCTFRPRTWESHRVGGGSTRTGSFVAKQSMTMDRLYKQGLQKHENSWKNSIGALGNRGTFDAQRRRASALGQGIPAFAVSTKRKSQKQKQKMLAVKQPHQAEGPGPAAVVFDESEARDRAARREEIIQAMAPKETVTPAMFHQLNRQLNSFKRQSGTSGTIDQNGFPMACDVKLSWQRAN